MYQVRRSCFVIYINVHAVRLEDGVGAGYCTCAYIYIYIYIYIYTHIYTRVLPSISIDDDRLVALTFSCTRRSFGSLCCFGGAGVIDGQLQVLARFVASAVQMALTFTCTWQ